MPQKRDKNSEFAITLRERLTDLRKEKLKLTQTEFAKYVGISTSSVGLYETGERIPDAETLYKISSKCNVSTDYLLGISSVSTTDTEIKTICEYTGLSETSVNILDWWNREAGEDKLDIINFLLESEWASVINDFEVTTTQITDRVIALDEKYKLDIIGKIAKYFHREPLSPLEIHWVAENGRIVDFPSEVLVYDGHEMKFCEIIEKVICDNLINTLKEGKKLFNKHTN